MNISQLLAPEPFPAPGAGPFLAVACGCTAEAAAARLQGSTQTPASLSLWRRAARLLAADAAPRIVPLPPAPDRGRELARLTAEMDPAGTVVLCLGDGMDEAEMWDAAFFCCNLPAADRLIATADGAYSMNKVVNVCCKASEQEWRDSDDQAVACTLYGNVGKGHSGLHSLFLGKESYERFIDSYYLQDMLKIRYLRQRPEKFYDLMYLALACAARGKRPLNFTEIGATLWSTIDKIAFCHSRLGLDVPLADTEWISIELSDYLRQLSHLLHMDRRMTFFDRWQRLERTGLEIGFSHLVTPYAFSDPTDVARWIGRFGYCLWVNDFTFDATRHLRVNGKRWTLLALPAMLELLKGMGLEVTYVDSQNLDPEGQIKRATLIVHNPKRFAMADYRDLISRHQPVTGIHPCELRPFNFDPRSLWQSLNTDENYFAECARNFSAGFAGALALTETGPYELRWQSPPIEEKIRAYLHESGGEAGR